MNPGFIHETGDSQLCCKNRARTAAQTNWPFRIVRLISWLCSDETFVFFDPCNDFAIVISDVGVSVRIVSYRHGYTGRVILLLRFRRLASAPDSGQDAASGI